MTLQQQIQKIIKANTKDNKPNHESIGKEIVWLVNSK